MQLIENPKEYTKIRYKIQDQTIFPYASDEDVETEILKIPLIIAKNKESGFPSTNITKHVQDWHAEITNNDERSHRSK